MAAAVATVVVDYPVSATKNAAGTVLNEIIAVGRSGMTYSCDVSDGDEGIKVFSEMIQKYDTVDILVNNAGLQRDAKFTEIL